MIYTGNMTRKVRVVSVVPRFLSSRDWATWLFFAIGTLLFATLVFYTRDQDQKRSMVQEAEWLGTLTRVVEKTLSNQLLLTNRALDGMLREKTVASETLQQLATSLPGVRSLQWIDRYGIVKASSRAELVGLDFSDQEFFVEAQKNPMRGQFVLSRPVESVLGTMILNGVKVLTDRQGGFIGLVVAAFDPEYYKVVLDSVRDRVGSWARLYHGAGYQYLTMTEGSSLLTALETSPGTAFAKFQASGLAYWNQSSLNPSSGGFPSMSSFRQIRPAQVPMDFPLVVEIGQDLTPLKNSWGQNDLISWGSFVFTSIALALVLVFFGLGQNRHQKDSLRYNTLLKESALRFQLATEAAQLGVWEWNAAADLLSWDSQMFRLYGLETGDFQPNSQFWESLIWDDELPAMKGFLGLAASVKTGGTFRCRIRHSDGTPRWMQFQYRYHTNESGEGRLVGVNNDITSDVTGAKALLESERFLKTVTEIAPTSIAYFDRKTVCLFANSRYAATFFRGQGEIQGMTFEEILGLQTFNQRLPVILDALEGKPTDLQVNIPDSEGNERSYWVHYIPDVQDDGVAALKKSLKPSKAE